MTHAHAARPFLALALASGMFLAASHSQASEEILSPMRARTTVPRVHSDTHAIGWAKNLLMFRGGAADGKRFYVNANPQMFELLMTAIKIDAWISIKYESTTHMVTSLEIY